jgi:hypothetical protein
MLHISYNIHIPPSSANARYLPDVSKLLDTDDDTLLLEDFNAHHAAWQSLLDDYLADQMEISISSSSIPILRPGAPRMAVCPLLTSLSFWHIWGFQFSGRL